jgi:hypothetical protein
MPRFSVSFELTRQSSWNHVIACPAFLRDSAAEPTPFIAPPLACCHCRTIPGVWKPCG